MGKATQRAIDILELLAHDDGKWSHAEIARRLDIPKSTLTDLLRDLVQRQYLELDSGAALYLLGPRVLTLSRAYLQRMDIVSRGREVLLKLCSEVEETVYIAVPKEDEVVVVAHESPNKPLIAAMTLGDRAPMPFTAAGKALLAFMNDAGVQSIVTEARQKKPRFSPPMNKASLLKELDTIRRGALAYSRQEWIEGISAVGLPIFGAEGPVGSLIIVVPAIKMTRDWLASIETNLRSAAAHLSMRMGGVDPHLAKSEHRKRAT